MTETVTGLLCLFVPHKVNSECKKKEEEKKIYIYKV